MYLEQIIHLGFPKKAQKLRKFSLVKLVIQYTVVGDFKGGQGAQALLKNELWKIQKKGYIATSESTATSPIWKK